MTTHIWDPSALEVKADFTLSLELDEQVHPFKNADGSQQSVSVKVEATTVKFALGVLGNLHDGDDVLSVVGAHLFGDNFIEIMEEHPEDAATVLTETHEKFLEFSFTGKGEEEDQDIEVTILAPSGLLAYQAFQNLTSSKHLSALAASFMPVESDDDF
jgi:hypothetical protein